MSFLFFGAILASFMLKTWVPILIVVGIPTVAVMCAFASRGSALDVRLV